MAVLSKLAGGCGWVVLPHNCYELAHTWNPSCAGAAFDLASSAFPAAFRTYAPLYVATLLSKRPHWRNVNVLRLLADSLRSSVFLTVNGYLFIVCICLMRHAMGFFVLPTIGFLNGVAASFCAILIEQKGRRGMLALHLTNLASEVVYRAACERGYLLSVPRGEVLPFAFALAGYFYLVRHGQLEASTERILKHVFAYDQRKPVLNLKLFPKQLASVLIYARQFSRHHRLCAHQHSCVSAALEPFVRNAGVAAAASGAIEAARALLALFRGRRPTPRLTGTLSVALFAGALPALYQATLCALHRRCGGDGGRSHALAGAVAALAMLVYPSTSLSLYITWKLIETLYFKGVQKGWLPYHRHGDILLYSFSTGVVLGAACLSPQSLRATYWRFLMDLTGTRFQFVNRRALDAFGCDSSKLFQDVRMMLDPLKTTMNPVFMP